MAGADRLVRTLAGALSLVLLPAALLAQAPSTISFQSIANAQHARAVECSQIRYAFDGGSQGAAGEWVAIQEHLLVEPISQTSGASRSEPHFRLEFEGIVGQSLSATELSQREDLYWSYAGYLFQHGGFRVDDPAAAAQNYLLFYLDTRTRISRVTHRFAVLPRVFGRTAWLIDVDAATSYPLYTAEFNAAGQLVSALEVTTFQPDPRIQDKGIRWWEPVQSMQEYPTVAEALTALPAADLPIPQPHELPAGYRLRGQRIVTSDVNARQSLVLRYGDGIDEFFVVHAFNAMPPALPAVPSGEQAHPYSIVYYQDLSVAQLLYYVDGVETMVIGRAGQWHLAALARELLRRAALPE